MLSSILKGSRPRELEYEYYGVQITSEPHTINYSEVGGVNVGDEIYILAAARGTGTFRVDTPTGYTSLGFDDTRFANRLVYREIDGTEGSSVIIEGDSDMCAVMLKIIAGASRTVGTIFADRRPDAILPEITATSGLLFVLATASDDAFPYDLAWGTVPSGMTELLAQDSSGVTDSMLYALYVEEIDSGATGTRTIDVNNGTTSDYLAGVLLNIYL